MATQNSTNSPFPLAAAKGGLGLASPTIHGILVGQGSSAVTPIVLTDGQILIGTTGADPSAATITQGTGISITSAAGSITIANSQSSLTYSEVTGTTQAIAVNNAYILNNASAVTATLPGTAALGSVVRVIGKGAGGWVLAQPASVLIKFGDQNTTTGTGGSLASTNTFDCVEMVCTVANTTWTVMSAQGNITVV